MAFFDKVFHVKSKLKSTRTPQQPETLNMSNPSNNKNKLSKLVHLKNLNDAEDTSFDLTFGSNLDDPNNDFNSAPTKSYISLALPKFWESSPTAWFTVAESLFSAQNVVSEHIKFHSLVNALGAKHIEKVKHVLMFTSSTLQYTSLKQALIKSFEASDNFKLNKLLSLPALDHESNNSKRPTELLQEMRCLLG